MFALLLTHCTPELEQKMKGFAKWAAIINNHKNVIEPAVIIGAVVHKQTSQHRGQLPP